MRRLGSRGNPQSDGFLGRLLAISAVGLLVRAGYVLAFTDHGDPHPVSDRFFFIRAAELLGEGEGFVHPLVHQVGLDDPASAGHPPLWILVLTPLAKVGLLSPLSARLLGCVAGAVAVLLIGLIGRRMFGERVGLIAAAAAAVYPAWVFADGSGMAEALYLALVCGSVLALLAARDSHTAKTAAAAGLLIGLAALARTEGLMLVLFAAVPLLWRQWRLVAVTAVAAVLTVMPWTIRNAIELERFVPVSTNVDTVFAGANCEETYFGRNTGLWSGTCLAAATQLAPDARAYDEGALAAGWRASAVSYARDHVERVPVVVAARVARLWRLWQPLREGELTEGVGETPAKIGALSFLLVLLPLGLLGTIAGGIQRRHLALFAGLAAMVTLASAIGWGAPRFLRPAELALLLSASAFIATRGRMVRPRAAERTREPTGR